MLYIFLLVSCYDAIYVMRALAATTFPIDGTTVNPRFRTECFANHCYYRIVKFCPKIIKNIHKRYFLSTHVH